MMVLLECYSVYGDAVDQIESQNVDPGRVAEYWWLANGIAIEICLLLLDGFGLKRYSEFFLLLMFL